MGVPGANYTGTILYNAPGREQMRERCEEEGELVIVRRVKRGESNDNYRLVPGIMLRGRPWLLFTRIVLCLQKRLLRRKLFCSMLGEEGERTSNGERYTTREDR